MSAPAEVLAMMMQLERLPDPEREYRFHPVRKWRFDFAWPGKMIAVEVDGGTWSGGRHTRGAGFEKDCEKVNTAVLMGWRVFRFTTGMVDRGEALQVITRALTLPDPSKFAELEY